LVLKGKIMGEVNLKAVKIGLENVVVFGGAWQCLTE
jgi:hypothetical protein